jgi:hypothetical protein
VATALGKSKPLWDSLLRDLAEELGVATREWHCYSRKAGWALRLKRGDRAIVYLSPCRGSFMASFALGAKALEAARQSGLSEKALATLSEARRYAEGTGVRIQAAAAADAADIRKLAAAKIAH